MTQTITVTDADAPEVVPWAEHKRTLGLAWAETRRARRQMRLMRTGLLALGLVVTVGLALWLSRPASSAVPVIAPCDTTIDLAKYVDIAVTNESATLFVHTDPGRVPWQRLDVAGGSVTVDTAQGVIHVCVQQATT